APEPAAADPGYRGARAPGGIPAGRLYGERSRAGPEAARMGGRLHFHRRPGYSRTGIGPQPLNPPAAAHERRRAALAARLHCSAIATPFTPATMPTFSSTPFWCMSWPT